MTFLKQLYMFRTTNSLTLRSTFWLYIHLSVGTALAQWLRCCVTNRKVAGSIPDGVIWIFHWHKIHYGPGVDSPSNRDEYQEYFLGGKGGRCVRLATLPPSCAVVMKSGNLNFLEPSGPLQACNGTALSFTAFGTMHWLLTTGEKPCHRSAVILVRNTKSCIYSQKVLLKMGEFVARNM